MAERDRFEQGLGAGWLSAFRWSRDETAPIEEIADKLVKTLARDLRTESGVPRWGDLLAIIQSSSPTSLLNCYDALDRIALAENGHRHVKIAADVAKSILAQMPPHSSQATTDISSLFAERVCAAIIENRFFGKAEAPLLMEGKFSSYNEFRQWQRRIEQLMQSDLSRIAENLLLHPNAYGLRAPRRKVRKRTTSELLRENLLAE